MYLYIYLLVAQHFSLFFFLCSNYFLIVIFLFFLFFLLIFLSFHFLLFFLSFHFFFIFVFVFFLLTFFLSFSFFSISFSLVVQIFGWWAGEISVYLRELVSLMQPLLRLTQTNSDWLFLDEWKVNSHILEIISKETQTQINLIFQ